MVGVGRVTRAEVHRGDAAGGEIRHVRPGLLGADDEVARGAELLHERRVRRDGSGRSAGDEVESRPSRHELAEVALRLRRRPVRREAEVERGRRRVGDDVVCDPGLQPRDRDDLPELEPPDHRHARLESEQGLEAPNRVPDRVVGEPRPRRVSARPVEDQAGDEVAEAARVDLEVRRLEHDRERSLVHRAGFGKESGEGVAVGRELLSSEDEEPEVVAAANLGSVSCELERDGESPFHVARPEPVNGAGLEPAREVALRRDGVVVTDEKHERSTAPALGDEEECLVPGVLAVVRGRDEREDVLPDRTLASARRRDVHELERPRGEAFGERVHRRSVPRHNLAVTARQPDPAPGAEPERAFVVGVFPKGVDGSEELAELRELAHTAGVEPVAELVQHRARPDPRTFVGKGKLAELERGYASAGAEVLLVDDELSPTQQRSLEDALKARVVDRTQLILDIFAQHARSAEGKLQVELAQLEYNLPRMRGLWQHLERLGGGVGTRGPGESQLETDRRLARTRISLLKRRLRTLSAQRSTRRKERIRTSSPTIALAGYTNVGKSTLLNTLTGAHASVDDRLFETLDPTTRGFEVDGKRYLVTDTVGFIRRLPTQLVEGFAATLEETLVADLVLHVADASLPDGRLHETIAAVNAVLAEIGADDIPVELVLNKVDLLDPLARRRVANTFPRALQVSAQTGEGLDDLKARIAELFSDRFEDVRLLLPYSEGRALAELYGLGAPVTERRDTAEGVRIRARLPRAEIARFAQFLVAEEGDLEATAR